MYIYIMQVWYVVVHLKNDNHDDNNNKGLVNLFLIKNVLTVLLIVPLTAISNEIFRYL